MAVIISLDQFVHQYTGVGIDYDGSYGFQCVDLANQWSIEGLGGPAWGGNAVDKFYSYPEWFFDRIENSISSIPQAGDIIIWGKGIGPYGHIAVVVSANKDGFTSFDQNWPVGSLPQKVGHHYGNVLGWLRKKGQTNNDDMSQAEKDRLQSLERFYSQVQSNRLGVVGVDGREEQYYIYHMPDKGHSDFIGVQPSDIRNIPAWADASAGDMIFPPNLYANLQAASNEAALAKSQLSECQGKQPQTVYVDKPVEVVKEVVREVETKVPVTETVFVDRPVEVPAQAKNLEELLVMLFKAIAALFTKKQ